MEKWQSVDNAMAHRKEAREKPSKVSKEYLSRLMQQEIIESGKIAKTLCQQSGSREVLLRSAKKMASQEVSMENTLSNMRQIEKLLDRALEQSNSVGRSLEQTSVIQDQLQQLTRH